MKYTLITGASSGIGEAFAKEFANQGKSLVLVARSKDKLDRLAEEFRKKNIEVKVIPLDLSKANSPEDLFDQCKNLEIETIINNAGMGHLGEFQKEDLKQIEDMIILNILAPTKICHLFLNQLKKSGGRILNISSTAGFQPIPNFNVYSATKTYLLYFSEALNVELKKEGVSVTVLAPGAVKTDIWGNYDTSRIVLPMSETQDVVKAGIQALEKRKGLIIPGFLNRLIVFSLRFAPRFLVPYMSKRMMGQ